jgi:signal transduction histidine kinase
MFDVTEQKRAEHQLEQSLAAERRASEELRQLNEMKDTFLHAVSHDLRTPLSAILGLATTLGRKDLELEVPERFELADRIAANARKLDALLRDLLDLERLDRGLIGPKRSPTDVGALVRGVLKEVDVGDRPMHVKAEPVIIAVDRAKVERIVDNLVSNAARHTPEGTDIWVSVDAMPGGVFIVVEDSGPGVAKADRELIFEPFGRSQGADQSSPGFGIGLSLVDRFSTLHEGRAWLEERHGGGARFCVFLPEGRPGTTHFA